MEVIYKVSLAALLLFCICVHLSHSQNPVAKGCNGEADVIFLIDTSRNVTQRDFNNSKDFVRRLVSRLDINFNLTRVGVAITEVGAYAKINLFFYGDKRLLLNGIDNMTRIEGVAQSLPGALRAVRNNMFTLQQGARNNIPDVLFIIAHDSIMYSYETDNELKNEIQATKGSRIFVGMVLYGNEKPEVWKMNRANSLVSQPVDENLIIVSDSGSLLLNSIVDRTQKRLCLEIPACAGLADIVFVLDRTGSIGYDNWKTELFFVKNVVENMYIAPDGIRIAVVVYGMDATLRFGLNEHQSKISILKAVEEILYDEATETRTDLALEMTRTSVFGTGNGNRINVRDIAIVVTDGSSSDEVKTRFEAKNARDRGIRMFAIGVKNNFDKDFQDELDVIGSDPDYDHVFQVSAFSNLDAIEDTLVRRTCREAPPNCTKQVDMVFAIDASGSITEENFQRVVNFVRDLVARLGVENGTARVGIVAFSDQPYLQFHLNRYQKVSDITRRISNIKYTQGTTMTASALNYVKDNMFTVQNGDRPNADNILLVITDGESNNQTATVEAARLLRDKGTSVISLGVGDWVIPYELEGIASHPKVRNMFHVDDYETLFTATDLLVSTICDVVDDCVSNPCRNGGQCIDAMNQYYCKCATGYTGRDCDKSCSHKADIVFVLDSSGSIERENFYIMQQFVQDIIHGVGVDSGARIGIVSFSTNARVEFFLNEHNTTQTVLNAMNLRFTGGTTNTAEALRMLRDQMFIPSRGDRPDNINVGILLTDGKSNDRERTLQEAVETRKAGIHMSVIGVGSSIRPAELKGIASDPDDMNVYTVKDFNALTGIIETLLKDVCNENNECNPNPCQNGGTCLDGLGMYTCRCASGFTGTNCERACDNPMDIAFVLDNSGSIQRENFVFLIEAMKELVNQLDVQSGKVRIGLVSYNETAVIKFDFDDYNNKEDMKHALDQMRFQGGRTNTAGAIETMRRSLFRSFAGDRQFVPNYAVLFTDGLPNINRENTVPQAIEAKIDGTHVILVTVGSGLTKGRNYIQLQGIPSDPTAANFFNVPKYRELSRIVPDIANAMCNDVNECSSNPCKNGGQCVDGLRTYYCRCSDRYTGLNCERECLRQRDIVFVVDISGSIEENNGFDLERSFIKELIHGLDFSIGRTRVGFVTFARTATTRFDLNTYISDQAKQDILNAVVIDTVGFETNVAAAIREASNNVFRAVNGDRTGVENIILLVTDGKNTVVTDTETTDAANAAKRDSIKIYTIAIGENPNIGLLQEVASSPFSTYEHKLPKRSDVPETAKRVLENICV